MVSTGYLRFGYLAAKKLNYVDKKGVYAAINMQLNQEWRENGVSEPLGKICKNLGLLTSEQVEEILQSQLMEPNISWSEDTRFAKMLNQEKPAKQAIGEYIGKRIAERPRGETIFLSNSSTIYYAFRGMIKYGAEANVLTIHAAILAAYPSLKNKILSVRTIWKGRVDLDNALIAPDIGDTNVKSHLSFLYGEATHALISATGFDCDYGPMADNETAREVSRLALQSETYTCILIDHTKIHVGTKKNEPALLFNKKEWDEIRGRGNMEVLVSLDPRIPQEQANFEPILREDAKIRNIMSENGASESMIKEALRYHEWSRRLTDILTEIPFTAST